MPINYETRYACHPEDFKSYDTERIRHDFLIENVMRENEINLCYSHFDRYIAGGAVPKEGVLELKTIDPLKADYFMERREMGIINIGGPGQIEVDDQIFAIGYQEALYIGKGSETIIFHSEDTASPSKFYINSAPAHKTYITRKIDHEDAVVVETGSAEAANARSIVKLIEGSIVEVCQLQMGITILKPGSVWNTMPCHTHDRRMEVYFYYGLEEGQAVCHFMGQTEHTRHIWMGNEQAAISPPWSIHCGSGTGKYSFIWGMAGENLDYTDMDFCAPVNLK